jgi:cell division protein FtsQ
MEIARIVAPGRVTSILGFNVKDARKALKKHPWIADARVTRVYPDRLAIDINERTAFALWQNQDGLQIIDHDGRVLGAFDGRDHSLPLIVGKGAGDDASDFIATMDRFPSIASNARAYIKVGERRWDIELDNGITIMLPETNAETELARLVILDREQELLARDIRRIDMRLENRMIVKLSSEARQLIEEKRTEQLKLLASSRKERNT